MKRRQQTRDLSRRRPERLPRRRLLVVCEGQRTEPDYLLGYQRYVHNATVEIVIPPDRGDPRKVVEIAKSRKQSATAEARRQQDPNLAFDEVWCVFDRDDHERFADACQMARDNQFKLAVSNPCFELWVLLHFRDSPGMQHRTSVLRMLRDQLPDYDKRLEFNDVAQGVPDAVARAQRLDADATAMGEPERNPTTGVYRLANSTARSDDA